LFVLHAIERVLAFLAEPVQTRIKRNFLVSRYPFVCHTANIPVNKIGVETPKFSQFKYFNKPMSSGSNELVGRNKKLLSAVNKICI